MVGGAIVGSTLEKEGEEEGEEVAAIADVGTYEVVGTLNQSDARKPDSVTTVIPVRCWCVARYIDPSDCIEW